MRVIITDFYQIKESDGTYLSAKLIIYIINKRNYNLIIVDIHMNLISVSYQLSAYNIRVRIKWKKTIYAKVKKLITKQRKSFVCGVFPCYESPLSIDGFMRNELVSGFFFVTNLFMFLIPSSYVCINSLYASYIQPNTN